LIAQTDAVERLGPMLGHPGPIGASVVTVAPGIDAVNMTPKESLHQYALMVLRYETLYRALFENRAVRGFLSAIPGLDAYAMLGKAWWHTTETEAARTAGTRGATKPARAAPERPRYDLVILDGPASGHTATMLKIPQAILDTTPTGPLVKDTRALRELLSDRARSALVIVTLPEELPAIETRELAETTRRELGIGLGPLIVNAMPPDRLSRPPVGDVLDRLSATPRTTNDAAMGELLRLAEGVRARRQAADGVVASLAANPGLPILQLPWLPAVALGPREIDALAAVLGQHLPGQRP